MSSEDNWWSEAFQAEYLEIYAHRNDESAIAEAQGVGKKLNKEHGPILDACCGNGRHAAALADMGFNILAFDYSKDLLDVASERQQLAGRLFQADIRFLPFKQHFAAITLFFTAFGYFVDEQNHKVLHDLSDALLDDGLLMLDLPDPAHVRETLVPESEKHTDSGLHITERRRLEEKYVAKDVEIRANGELKRQYTERVRLYDGDELKELAAHAALDFEDCWPSLLGPDHDQQRKVYWFKKSR